MDYIRTEEDGQLAFTQSVDFLRIPCCLYGFHNTETDVKKAKSGRDVICFYGKLDIPEEERICKCCGARMHINNHPDIQIRHLGFGGYLSCLIFPHNQLRCPKCNNTKSQYIAFKAQGHLITEELHQYTRDLLATSKYTNKQVAELSGLHKDIVKAIDLERLKDEYTIDGKKLRLPEKPAQFLGIDEFKLHDNRKFATHIVDMTTGHILWIAEGKKKKVVYDFINHVGLDWMKSVKAVACDMNSDFSEAFVEKCPHIEIVYDHFHLINNFNEKVVSEVRKDEQKRLIEEGDLEAAKSLKGSKYILTSKRSTLQRKDIEALEEKVISKGSDLFDTPDVVRKAGYETRYDEILKQNRLLFTADLIKEKLDKAYQLTDEAKMATAIADIVYDCLHTQNKHFIWFANLLYNHHKGIEAHAKYKLSTGPIEGINNRIKTLRRQGYGYPDDEYFFLKLLDMSRQRYVRNPKSHRILD